MKEKNDIPSSNNTADNIAALSRSVLGVVPFAGSALSEIVTAIIPNQRIDRLTKYVSELEKRMADIPKETIEKIVKDDKFIDLIEESFVQASRALSNERLQYIAAVVGNGITDDQIAFEESKLLLKLMSELNDIEIIWLRFYKIPTIGGDNEFRNKHKNVLEHVRTYIGVDKGTLQKAALQDSYRQHLERLGLIKSNIRISSETKQPEYDSFSGQPKTSYSETTILGKMLLEQMDFK